MSATRSWIGAAAFALVALASPAGVAAQAQVSGVERVMAFADVHGAFDELQGLLREAGVTDAADRWAAGYAHDVSLGDLLFRGAEWR